MASPASERASARIERLRPMVRGADGEPGLAAILPRLQRAHRKVLVRRERWTQGDLARHPEPRELIRSARRPGNMDEHRRLLRVFDARRVLVEDVHENRVVRYVVGEVRRRLGTLVAAGDRQAAELLHELDAAVENAPFLRAVGVLNAKPTVPTATMSGDPLYRRVFKTWLELERESSPGSDR